LRFLVAILSARLYFTSRHFISVGQFLQRTTTAGVGLVFLGLRLIDHQWVIL
jgi:hypothetical protein